MGSTPANIFRRIISRRTRDRKSPEGAPDKKNPICVTENRLQGKIIKSHDLIRLATEATITLSKEEKTSCELGTKAIRWFGRYPIPLAAQDLPSLMVIEDKVFLSFEQLYAKLNYPFYNSGDPPLTC